MTGGVRRNPIIKIAGTKSVRYMVYANQSHRQEASTQTSGEGRNIIACPLQNIKTGDIDEGAYKL